MVVSFSQLSFDDLNSELKRFPNRKSPGPDLLIYGIWLKKFTSLHSALLVNFNEILSEASTLDPKLATGRTVLIIKDLKRGNIPTNYRPITCLSQVYKLLTGILRHLSYKHLDSNDLSLPNKRNAHKSLREQRTIYLWIKCWWLMSKDTKICLYHGLM